MALYTRTLFLITVVKFFSKSSCATTVKPEICGDLSLQYVFSLVPSSSELQSLTKFLANIESANIFESTPDDEGLVQVVCDAKDWAEIYRYTKDRGIYFLHSAYCVENRDFPALQELRLRRNKLRKAVGNELAGGAREKKSLKDFNGKVKNVSRLKTIAVNSPAKKNRDDNTGLSKTTTRTPGSRKSTKSGKRRTSTSTAKPRSRRGVKSGAGSPRVKNTFRIITERYTRDVTANNNSSSSGDESELRTLNHDKCYQADSEIISDSTEEITGAGRKCSPSDVGRPEGTTLDDTASENPSRWSGGGENSSGYSQPTESSTAVDCGDNSANDNVDCLTLQSSSLRELSSHIHGVIEWLKGLKKVG